MDRFYRGHAYIDCCRLPYKRIFGRDIYLYNNRTCNNRPRYLYGQCYRLIRGHRDRNKFSNNQPSSTSGSTWGRRTTTDNSYLIR